IGFGGSAVKHSDISSTLSPSTQNQSVFTKNSLSAFRNTIEIIVADCYTEVRGECDISSILARQEVTRFITNDGERATHTRVIRNNFKDLIQSAVAQFGENSYRHNLLAIGAIKMALQMDLPRNESNALFESGIRLLAAANPASRKGWDITDITDLSQLSFYYRAMAKAIQLEDKHSAIFYLQEALSVNEPISRKIKEEVARVLLAQRALNSRIELIGDLTSLGRAEEAAELRASLEKSAFLHEMQTQDLTETLSDGLSGDQ
ncbi:hypothetical protein LZ32DRAFT_667612, partial [Colletotrichum eremochloae]